MSRWWKNLTVNRVFLAPSMATMAVGGLGSLVLGQEEQQEAGKQIQVQVQAEVDRAARDAQGQLSVVVGKLENQLQDVEKTIRVQAMRPSKYWLGVQLKEVEGDLAKFLGSDDGIFVEEVIEDSPAAAAKLQAGDVILKYDDTELEDASDLLAKMSQLEKDGSAPQSVELTIVRKGKKMVLQVTPEERPQTSVVEGKAINELKAVLKKLPSEGNFEIELNDDALEDLRLTADGLSIFRFGQPSAVWKGKEKGAVTVDGDVEMIIIKKDDKGEDIKVKVTRPAEQPAKVTVKRGGHDVEEYETEDLKNLPEDVQILVKPLIGNAGGQAFQIQVQDAAAKHTDDGNAGNLKMYRFNFASPEAVIEMQAGDDVHEIAEKYRVYAEEAAEKARKQALEARRKAERFGFRGGNEIAELKAMVEQLRQEIEQLKGKQAESEPSKSGN